MNQATPGPTTLKNSPLTVDVFSDVVCPWCFIGLKQLEGALLQLPEFVEQASPVQVRFRPYQLNPQMPATGIARSDYLQAKFGNPTGAGMYERVKGAAAQVNLDLKLEDIKQQPNTLKAHALLHVATGQTHWQLAGHLFKAWFQLGADLSQDEVLISIALSAGLNTEQIVDAWSEMTLTEVAEQDRSIRQAGVSGVPLFIINRSTPLSGAVGSQALLQGLVQASRDQ